MTTSLKQEKESSIKPDEKANELAGVETSSTIDTIVLEQEPVDAPIDEVVRAEEAFIQEKMVEEQYLRSVEAMQYSGGSYASSEAYHVYSGSSEEVNETLAADVAEENESEQQEAVRKEQEALEKKRLGFAEASVAVNYAFKEAKLLDNAFTTFMLEYGGRFF